MEKMLTNVSPHLDLALHANRPVVDGDKVPFAYRGIDYRKAFGLEHGALALADAGFGKGRISRSPF
jgi:hypothetical protein